MNATNEWSEAAKAAVAAADKEPEKKQDEEAPEDDGELERAREIAMNSMKALDESEKEIESYRLVLEEIADRALDRDMTKAQLGLMAMAALHYFQEDEEEGQE